MYNFLYERIFNPLECILRSENAGSLCGNCGQHFEDMPNCFPLQLGIYQGSNFSSSSTTLIFLFLNYTHHSRYEVIFHFQFWCAFPWQLIMLNIFLYATLVKYLFKFFGHILNGCLSFVVELCFLYSKYRILFRWCANVLSHHIGHFFTLLIYFEAQKF